MNVSPNPSIAEAIGSAFEWWKEAGLTNAMDDTAQPWITDEEEPTEQKRPVRVKKKKPAETPVMLGGDSANWPDSLEAFQKWWAAPDSIADGGTYPRIAPSGSARAPLMIIVPEPESEDSDFLLSGPQGRLIDNMLLSMQLTRENVYLTAALPCHMPFADWDDLNKRGLGRILAYHISLAQPERLLLLGRIVPPLIGHDPAQSNTFSYSSEFQDTAISCLAGRSPELLLKQPKLRARLWNQWLDWTGDDPP
ncbi:uracil-DNA glycosylase family protein [Altericroceibacterium endophyticum]|uniref:Uracil-DNA glycosylase-like domain-containing protein n=1 Tax=Altericroceibacterium endophyticum TaxID=1808508 RepID=A0A6I4T585_9SPHN|nr:uracil-DNA glycosylase family protein [Altericroceibacterium endophyticum]MXO66046.1 hypothetical protein [Altericroceibacterium endophyticum]